LYADSCRISLATINELKCICAKKIAEHKLGDTVSLKLTDGWYLLREAAIGILLV